MVDKLLTLKEAAEALGLSEEKVTRLVENGTIPAYQIGGVYLRFKEEQILLLMDKYKGSGPKDPVLSARNIKGGSSEKPSFFSEVRDFLYFNDFYILSVIIAILLLYIIIKSIR